MKEERNWRVSSMFTEFPTFVWVDHLVETSSYCAIFAETMRWWTLSLSQTCGEKSIIKRGKYEKQSSETSSSLKRSRKEPNCYDTTTPRSPLRRYFCNTPLPLCIQTELVDERMKLVETVAGAELSREMLDVTRKQEAEINQLLVGRIFNDSF